MPAATPIANVVVSSIRQCHFDGPHRPATHVETIDKILKPMANVKKNGKAGGISM